MHILVLDADIFPSAFYLHIDKIIWKLDLHHKWPNSDLLLWSSASQKTNTEKVQPGKKALE